MAAITRSLAGRNRLAAVLLPLSVNDASRGGPAHADRPLRSHAGGLPRIRDKAYRRTGGSG